MPFFIRGPSIIPRSCPLFDPIWDGPEPIYERRDAPLVRLEGCFPLGPETKPPSTVLLSKAICCSAHKSLPDFFGVCGTLCISRAFKTIIEHLEPNAHQYFNIDLYKKNKELFEGSYFLFNILKTERSLILEKSDLQKARFSDDTDFFILGGGTERTLAAADSMGSHVWRESVFLRDIYMSDEVMRLFKRDKMRGLDYLNCHRAFLEI